jgi:hypothetical protein
MRSLLVALALLVCAAPALAQRQQRVAVVLPYAVTIRTGDPRAIAAEEREALRRFVLGSRTGRGAAKQHILIPLPEGANVRTLEAGDYSKERRVDKAQRIVLSGFTGPVRAIHLGTMSVHDLYDERTGAFDQKTFDLRLAHDRMGLEIDGQRLLDRAEAGHVSMNEIVIPKGAREIEYLRQAENGRVVGDRVGYKMGRLLKLSWE